MITINTILLSKKTDNNFFHYSLYNSHLYKAVVSEYVFNNDLLYKTVKTKKRLAFYISREYITKNYSLPARWPLSLFFSGVKGFNRVSLFNVFKLK